MTGKDSQLRKENQQLRNEVAELKKHLEKLSVEIGDRTEKSDRAAANHGGDSSSETKAKSVEFVSAQYDELQAFRKYASEEMPATDFRNRLIHLKYTAISSTSKSLDCRCWLNGSLQSKRQISAYSFFDKCESKKYQSMI